MRDNNILTQFASRVAAVETKGEPEPVAEVCEEDNLGAYGWLRGVRERAVMLELRRRDGSVVALGYAWLERAEFDPSTGMTLSFTGKTVKLIGRNLNTEVRPLVRLFDGLCRHRVPWIQEADEPTALAADRQAIVVERIEIE
jgi:hypothetical protein